MKRNNMKYLFWGLLSLFMTTLLSGQTTPTHQYANNRNAWLMYFGDHKVSDHWGVHLEAQLRRADWGRSAQQLLLRTGLNYHLSAQVFATLGYCYVETYPYGDFPAAAAFPEHRIWQQIQVKNQLGHFEWINRLRLEQRWSQLPVKIGDTNTFEPGEAVYTNRVRLFNRVSLPFKGNAIVDKSLYITVYDEILVNFGNNIGTNFFDQNRAYIALGYKLPKVGRLEAGYLLQRIHKSDGVKIESNHTLQFGLSSTIDFFKHKNND